MKLLCAAHMKVLPDVESNMCSCIVIPQKGNKTIPDKKILRDVWGSVSSEILAILGPSGAVSRRILFFVLTVNRILGLCSCFSLLTANASGHSFFAGVRQLCCESFRSFPKNQYFILTAKILFFPRFLNKHEVKRAY